MLLFDDSKKLETALGEEAAAVLAHVFEKADDSWRRDLATKADIQGLRETMATKAELQSVRETMATKAELQSVRNDLIERISDARAETQAVRAEMQAMKNELIKWMVGGYVALGAFFTAVMAFLR
jgi:uncharacterized protein YPO0396